MIESSKDFVRFVSETMEGVQSGAISAAAGNSVANLGGKLIQMIALEMKVADFAKLKDRASIMIEAPKK